MNPELKLAMIGLDTSHVEAFAKLLHQKDDPYHVPGGRVVAAFPGGSPDFALSRDRLEKYTACLRDEHGVEILDSPEAAVERADAVMLESVDGRVHREQFERIAGLGKPVFIDKPFAVTTEDALAIAKLADHHGIGLMSCSSLRYAAGLQEALSDESLGAIIGADFFGPMALHPTQPGLFWYGIHTAEMLFTTLGAHFLDLKVSSNDDHDLVVAEWKDGRIGTVRGNRRGNHKFGGMVHRENGSVFIDVYSHPKPYYASLLEKIIPFFQSGVSPVASSETLAIVRFLEQANAGR